MNEFLFSQNLKVVVTQSTFEKKSRVGQGITKVSEPFLLYHTRPQNNDIMEDFMFPVVVSTLIKSKNILYLCSNATSVMIMHHLLTEPLLPKDKEKHTFKKWQDMFRNDCGSPLIPMCVYDVPKYFVDDLTLFTNKLSRVNAKYPATTATILLVNPHNFMRPRRKRTCKHHLMDKYPELFCHNPESRTLLENITDMENGKLAGYFAQGCICNSIQVEESQLDFRVTEIDLGCYDHIVFVDSDEWKHSDLRVIEQIYRDRIIKTNQPFPFYCFTTISKEM